jgi:tetratricopeptide (TPR) repeat protein
MKNRIPTIVLMMWAGTLLYAQDPDRIFDQANVLYQQGKFEEAGRAYESLIQNGYSGGEVFYNLGNCYYKRGILPKAIIYYERARRVMPNDDDLQHNLQLANLMITDKIDPTPRLFVWEFWDGVKDAFSLRGITWLGYGVFVCLAASVMGFVLARSFRAKKAALLAGIGSAVLLVLILLIFGAKFSALHRTDAAIVTANITTVKNSPDAKSSDAFVVHGGLKVQITDRVNEWVKIRLADGKVGWMENSAAEVI